eukprot:6544601-Pyramimonas_sp.AAC.1
MHHVVAKNTGDAHFVCAGAVGTQNHVGILQMFPGGRLPIPLANWPWPWGATSRAARIKSLS